MDMEQYYGSMVAVSFIDGGKQYPTRLQLESSESSFWLYPHFKKYARAYKYNLNDNK
jgi:hypothetical protein